jgi:large subunit ribosomal protein L25
MAHVEDLFKCKPRIPSKKGAARRLRKAGWIPAVAYGSKTKVRHLSLDPKSFLLAREQYGLAHVFDVNVEGEDSFKALIKATSQNPVSRNLLHVDFYAVDMSKEVRVSVRIELEGKAKGVVMGGIVQQVLRRVEVDCLPGNTPEKLVVDVSELELNDSIHVKDLTLPEGVKSHTQGTETIVILHGTRESRNADEADGEPEAVPGV